MSQASSSFAIAVHALALLASADGWVTSARIAKSAGASRPYVRAILASLADAGLVVTAEGRRGGYMLARRPAAIRLSDVYVAVGGDEHVLTPSPCESHPECFIGAGMADSFARIAASARAGMLKELARLTVADANRIAHRASGIPAPDGFRSLET